MQRVFTTGLPEATVRQVVGQKITFIDNLESRRDSQLNLAISQLNNGANTYHSF